jgi:hypothetical protein
MGWQTFIPKDKKKGAFIYIASKLSDYAKRHFKNQDPGDIFVYGIDLPFLILL